MLKTIMTQRVFCFWTIEEDMRSLLYAYKCPDVLYRQDVFEIIREASFIMASTKRTKTKKPRGGRRAGRRGGRAKLSEADIKRVAVIVFWMCHCLNTLLEPKLRKYIKSIAGTSRIGSDPQKQLKHLIKEKLKKGNRILPEMTLSQLKLALKGRTVCIHNHQSIKGGRSCSTSGFYWPQQSEQTRQPTRLGRFVGPSSRLRLILLCHDVISP